MSGSVLAVRKSWGRLPLPLRILRVFLGLTFTYAGLQKFADPGYLHSGARDFIGTQLHAFAHGSPLGFLLQGAAKVPLLTGIVVALGEMVVGIATLLGVAPLIWAGVGAAINLVLFFSATWHIRPYFLGSDSIYAVAWLAYVAGIVELRRTAARAQRAQRPPRARHGQTSLAGSIQRREVIRGGIVAGLSMFVAGVGVLSRKHLPRTENTSALSPAQTGSEEGSENASGTQEAGETAPASAPRAPAERGKTITQLRKLPVGGAVGFKDPSSGDPSVLLRPSRNEVVAFSRVCTHAGCLVEYDDRARILFCPCHGAEFDPAHGAQPITGPAYDPLPPVKVSLDPSTGNIVAG